MNNNRKPKPDDRSDNVEKLQEMVHNTIENMEEAEATMEFSSSDDQEHIKAKNERRRESIEGMREEIKDEASEQHNQEY
ncbi:small acid-soluble spore protein Tlp [Lederbergia wuyishanensis]|uniref:Small, acid-soluble spore protein Tlp n=1 Tax=Lederbergia wuyishanensis TaxID=1347903 RepID=A0ABU0D036_9BACI|nr:small acid-soluble spore protein Tlp [Lederbergia wuyishanensis]MCJ8006388.1 small acid-soluble spore protein Tlp [Lederbergia wuyishanensis]MDQ0341758.1 small acid-soluble spore protein (thioredoxin-like protein) [Lederbergia wuyishanensis]